MSLGPPSDPDAKDAAKAEAATLGVRQFQQRIEDIYLARDGERGVLGTFAWFVEEVGELSRALRRREHTNLEEEMGDVFAWLVSLASLSGVDLATAAGKYARGCPRCHATPCGCPPPKTHPPR